MVGAWVYVGFNAEFVYFPFSSSRLVAELLAFNTEERRGSMLTYVVDLYAGDLNADPTGMNVYDAYLDRPRYYALAPFGSTHAPTARAATEFLRRIKVAI